MLVRTWSDGEASLIRQLLGSYGIPSQVVSDVPHALLPLSVDVLGEIRVLVPAEHWADAQALIADHRRHGLRVLRGGRHGESGGTMKRKSSGRTRAKDRDTLRAEYDFSGGARGVTAARYAEGVNVMPIDPAVLDVFPDARAVNEALRALAPVLRRHRKRRSA